MASIPITPEDRDATNDTDMVFWAAEVERFTFDVDTLDSGFLQASDTVGLTDMPT